MSANKSDTHFGVTAMNHVIALERVNTWENGSARVMLKFARRNQMGEALNEEGKSLKWANHPSVSFEATNKGLAEASSHRWGPK